MYVIKNCRLIPELTEGTGLTTADIVVDGERIKTIQPCGTPVEEDCEVLDAEEMTVMPGMIDMHTHLRMMSDGNTSDPLKPCAVTLDEYIFAQYYLDNGYTTVRDVGDNIANPSIALRNHINAGKLSGPRIFCSGPTLTPTEIGFDAAWSAPNHYEVDSPMDMRQKVRYVFQQGADFIKLYGTSSMVVKEGTPGKRIMEADEMEEAVRIAAAKGSYCAIHSHGTECCDVAAKIGVRTIEHASFISEDTLKYLETRKAEGHGIVITASVLIDDSWGKIPDYAYAMTVDHLKHVKDYDVLVGWGTDTSIACYKKNPYSEFELRKKELGFSNLEILKQLTINSAVLMQKDHLIGSIKEGKYADLNLVDGAPEERIEVMYQKPVHVMKGGVLVR